MLEIDPNYVMVKSKFSETLPNFKIVKIEEIINQKVLNVYNKCPTSNPQLLFHGCKTLSNFNNIVASGFDISYSRSGAHGTGLYFARTAAFSDKYAAYTSG